MWSSFYQYYQIRKDKRRSQLVDTKKVRAIITSFSSFTAKGNLIFHSDTDKPWMTITLVQTKDGNYAVNELADYKEINLIEVITSRKSTDNEAWYLSILKTIATELEWQIILEEDDEGNEEIHIK